MCCEQALNRLHAVCCLVEIMNYVRSIFSAILSKRNVNAFHACSERRGFASRRRHGNGQLAQQPMSGGSDICRQ